MSASFSQTAAYIWSLADLLRGDFKPSQYGRVILPFTILRRLECVLEPTKTRVLNKVQDLQAKNLPPGTKASLLLQAAEQCFFNTSPMCLATLGKESPKANLLAYVAGFSRDARDIFQHFRFEAWVEQLHGANLLSKVVARVATTDLHPNTISNRDMGLVFEELIRRFAESSNETAGEHFTPRDIVRLTTALVFGPSDELAATPGILRTIYDPTAGTGGFLSSGLEYLREHYPNAEVQAFGQELNPESFAVCKGDLLIKGQDLSRIKLGNTLRQDQLRNERFDYLLSNPPFGVDWKKIQSEIRREHEQEGFDGRFGPGLPRVSDGSLLFLLHLISKMRPYDPSDPSSQGGRIGIVLSGSPLFTGAAGSGESEIRRYILEQDLLEAVIALPSDLFYNTSISTYLWILSNHKAAPRKSKVQLINAVHLGQKLRKSLGSKRRALSPQDIAQITGAFTSFSPQSAPNTGQDHRRESPPGRPFASKRFSTHEFGYRRIIIQRPLRLSAQLTKARLETLRYPSGVLAAPMRRLHEAFGSLWEANITRGELSQDQVRKARALLKAQFGKLKEKQLQDLCSPKPWKAQLELLRTSKDLLAQIGTEQFDDFNAFAQTLKSALAATGHKLDPQAQKQLLEAVTWPNPEAEPVVSKVLTQTQAEPLYGIFSYRGQIVQFKSDPNLRDHEDVPLSQETARGIGVNAANEAFFQREIAPHASDAWIDPSKRDHKDGQIGTIGYEIPFNRYFFEHRLPRNLEDIDADLRKQSQDLQQMLKDFMP